MQVATLLHVDNLTQDGDLNNFILKVLLLFQLFLLLLTLFYNWLVRIFYILFSLFINVSLQNIFYDYQTLFLWFGKSTNKICDWWLGTTNPNHVLLRKSFCSLYKVRFTRASWLGFTTTLFFSFCWCKKIFIYFLQKVLTMSLKTNTWQFLVCILTLHHFIHALNSMLGKFVKAVIFFVASSLSNWYFKVHFNSVNW